MIRNCLPRLAKLGMIASVYRPRSRRLRTRPLHLLIDRNLYNYAIRSESVARKETVSWGPYTWTDEIHGFRGKALPTEEWKRQQVEALPTIARLAREGYVVFCRSPELDFEAFNGSSKGLHFGYIFWGIDFKHVPSPVERSYFWKTLDLAGFANGEAQARWYKEFLLKIDEQEGLELLKEYEELPQFDRTNLANLSRFRDLCEYLDTDDHIRDAFHLWTAEVNNLDYFLTADRSFINKMTQSTPVDLPVRPISPSDLLGELGVKRLDPLPLADRRFRYIFEADD